MFNNLSRNDNNNDNNDDEDDDNDDDSFFRSIYIIINDLNHINTYFIIYNNNQYIIVKNINDILSFNEI
jgi:uncharacterized UPF0160 family protein